VDAIIKRGELLQQAKDLLHAHGSWVQWLKTRHEMPPRAAQRYMKAARFAKSATAAHLPACKLTVDTLYLLAEDRFWKTADI
jgi:hypothetical protein